MKTYSHLQIGQFHTNYCEDFLVVAPIGSHRKLIAVLDGCTMGTESAFASMLFGKVLRRLAKEAYYDEFATRSSPALAEQLKTVVEQLFREVRQQKNQLALETEELLTTLLIGIVDLEATQAEVLILGDGVVCADGVWTEFDQGNKPDYLAYHLGEDFDIWYDGQSQRLSYTGFSDFSMATDGILTFQNLKDPSRQKPEKEIIEFFMVDPEGAEHANFLTRKVRALEEQDHLVTDDLAVVRLIGEISA